jgi:hypothetical protein
VREIERRRSFMNQSRKALVVVAAGLAGCALFVATPGAAAPASPPQAVRVDLASGLPAFAPGYRLALTRAVIPAGGAFPPHRHPGMQVAYIQSGTLHFTVFRGVVKVYRGNADGSERLVRTLTAGQAGSIVQGEWLVETPAVWHQGANRGHKAVVILLATLLRAHEAPAIPVKP